MNTLPTPQTILSFEDFCTLHCMPSAKAIAEMEMFHSIDLKSEIENIQRDQYDLYLQEMILNKRD